MSCRYYLNFLLIQHDQFLYFGLVMPTLLYVLVYLEKTLPPMTNGFSAQTFVNNSPLHFHLLPQVHVSQ